MWQAFHGLGGQPVTFLDLCRGKPDPQLPAEPGRIRIAPGFALAQPDVGLEQVLGYASAEAIHDPHAGLGIGFPLFRRAAEPFQRFGQAARPALAEELHYSQDILGVGAALRRSPVQPDPGFRPVPRHADAPVAPQAELGLG